MWRGLAQLGHRCWYAWRQLLRPCGQRQSAFRSLCAVARMVMHRPGASGFCGVGVAPASIRRSPCRALRGGSVQPAAQADSRRQAAARGLASSLCIRLPGEQVRMVRFVRQSRSADCSGTSSLSGAAWRSSLAAASLHGANRRGRVAEVGRHSILFARRPARSSTSLSPQPSATWVWLRLASRVRSGRAFDLALHNLPVKWDVPRRAPLVRLALAVPPWAAPYLHRCASGCREAK